MTPPLAPASSAPGRKTRPYHFLIGFAVLAIPLIAIHLPLLSLPLFWDEGGQFIPTALDLFRHGYWVARSTVPNVHPPAVEAYLAFTYQLFGYSIPVTRIAMLLIGALGLFVTFLLAIELSRGTASAPAFLAPMLLFVSPLFYMQSMMAQLDMPAMVFSLLTLLLFLQRRYAFAAVISVLLVLCKETGLAVPFVFALVLLWRREWKKACYFLSPAVALGIWLVFLHHRTGYWLGDPGFAHYNVRYALDPVRLLTSFVRRIYYVFLAEFRWIPTLVIIYMFRSAAPFRSEAWRVAALACAAQFLLVTILGGAELERYLLPVLPVFYIAAGVALAFVTSNAVRVVAAAALLIGLAANLFWNPPYPFPYENNWAMVDFVRLQQTAAGFCERNLPAAKIATAWPFTAALREPDLGYVSHPFTAIETNDFHFRSVAALAPERFDVLIVYTRSWDPATGVLRFGAVRRFLEKYYDWQPEITRAQCATLGLQPLASWQARGQRLTIYTRGESNPNQSQSRIPIQNPNPESQSRDSHHNPQMRVCYPRPHFPSDMPRNARVVIPGAAHHITQRGNNRRDVFFSDQDRELYLSLLREYSSDVGVKITGYCLMTNHVHLIAIPKEACALGKALRRAHGEYARWLHIRRRESGHLWQNRYFSCPLDEQHVWAALAYVERNPLRASLVDSPEQWPWSSARVHLLHRAAHGGLVDLADWRERWNHRLWRVALQEGLAEADLRARLHAATSTGRPLGSADFVRCCEHIVQRSLTKQKPGPKKKQQPLELGQQALYDVA